MSQWKKAELRPWERAAAARAMGRPVDPEDVAEARRKATPDSAPQWARLVAEKAVGQSPQAPEPERKLTEFEWRLRRRLGVVDDGPPDAA